jgi:hypothetical protein
MNQLEYKVPVKRLRDGFGHQVQIMDVVRIREKEWRPVRITVSLFVVQLVGFGLFLWVGGSVN